MRSSRSSAKQKPPVPSNPTDRARILGPLLLFVAAVSVYAPSVRNDFIYDDVQIILGHAAPQNLGEWARIFSNWHFPGHFLTHRPVTRLTLLAQKSLSGDVAWPFHLFNALLMGAAALLSYAILRLPQMAVARAPALLAAALFALHPAASSCVYPISSGRETLLPSVWLLAAVMRLSARRGTMASHWR